MVYEVIRVAQNYRAVIVITPANAHPETPEAHCFQRADWTIGSRDPGVFHAISALEATLACGNHSKTWGFGELPGRTFETLAEVDAWVTEQKQEKH
jgi:hypothetical protein